MRQQRIRSANPQASSPKLAPSDVLRIKQLLAQGYSPRQIAAHYLLAAETVRRIDRGETWAWLRSEADLAPKQPGLGVLAVPEGGLTANEQSAAEESLNKLLDKINEQPTGETNG